MAESFIEIYTRCLLSLSRLVVRSRQLISRSTHICLPVSQSIETRITLRKDQ
jgi:hypothetical protein